MSTHKMTQKPECGNCRLILQVRDGTGKTLELSITPGQQIKGMVGNSEFSFSLMTEGPISTGPKMQMNSFDLISDLIKNGMIHGILVHGRMEQNERREFRADVPEDHFLKPLDNRIIRGHEDDATYGKRQEGSYLHVLQYIGEKSNDDLCALLPYFNYPVPEDGYWSRLPIGGKKDDNLALIAIKITTGRKDMYGRSGLSWHVSIIGNKQEMEKIYDSIPNKAELAKFLAGMIPRFAELEGFEPTNPMSCFPQETAEVPLLREKYPPAFERQADR